MPPIKRLPKPRTRYYVGEPVVVIPLAQLERLADHLTDVAMLDRKTINQQEGVRVKNRMVLKECRDELKAAKAYYKIVSTGYGNKKLPDDDA